MYVPAHFAPAPGTVPELLAHPGAANLVTMTDAGLLATLVPFVYEPPGADAVAGAYKGPGYGSLQGHLARNNPQWSSAPAGEALVIIQGPDAYISPSWYAAKAGHGRVVPTWNYTTAHVYGRLVVHEDPAWLARHVRRLTGLHEDGREHPWSVEDAPASFIAGQLRGIVGVELLITRIEAKEKHSQNRSDDDARGVAAGLRTEGLGASAAAVERARRPR